ncbi:MAG TPA: thiamine pyrophosphate-dependent enzyme, partial [Acidimicrobiales bacterium]|nr:thiamine pyrophosphate-dependent enzyme [Acidimicrobiales bacterium]
GAETVAVDPWWRWADPDRTVTDLVTADPGPWVEQARSAVPPIAPWGGEWLRPWQVAERAAQDAIDRELTESRLTEPGVARRLFRLLPVGTRVVVSSSMPVRDLEWYAPPVADPPPVLANRGANGIDGVASTAQGVAAAGRGPVVGVLGDLAFLHDVSSLVGPVGPVGPPTGSCTLLVVDNRGGGIFNFLPQAGRVERGRFEQLFGTPAAPDVADVARGFGVPVHDVGTAGELDGALSATVGTPGLSVVRARVPDRVENVAVHDRLHQAVADAVDEVGGPRR